MLENDKIKILNFLQDFGCCTLKQLQILFDNSNNNFKDILTSDFISKKGDIFVHNNSKVDMKMIYAFDVLCKYKRRLKQYHKGYEPVYISFLTKENLLYNIIVTDKTNEQGLLKLLKVESPMIPEADRFIFLFQDENCFEYIECSTPYVYCIYPELKIIQNK